MNPISFRFPFTVALAVAISFATIAQAGDWLQFRGSQTNSVASEAELPLKWDAETNIAWKAKLPGRGPASPIVVGDSVIVTCSDGVRQDLLSVISFDAESGEENWRRDFWATGRTMTHPSSAVAANTPASDGERIFAFFSSNDLICLDLEGNLLWYRGLAFDYPKAGNDVGMSSSPVVVDGAVIVQIESQGDSFAAGISAETGETLWRVAREPQSNWASPAIVPASGVRKKSVLLQSPQELTLVDPRTGSTLWSEETACQAIPSGSVSGNQLFVAGSDGMTAYSISKTDVDAEYAWDSSKLNPGAASPVVHDGHVCVVNRGGVLTVGSAESGDTLWQLRLEGSFWATPFAAGDRLYCVNDAGVTQVVSLGDDKGEVLAANDIGEKLQASPAVADGAIYLRSDSHLWKIAK